MRVELIATDPRQGGDFSGGKKKGSVKVMQVPIESPPMLPLVGRAKTPERIEETRAALAPREYSCRERVAFAYASPKREPEPPSAGKKKKGGALQLHPLPLQQLPLKNIKLQGKRAMSLIAGV